MFPRRHSAIVTSPEETVFRLPPALCVCRHKLLAHAIRRAAKDIEIVTATPCVLCDCEEYRSAVKEALRAIASR